VARLTDTPGVVLVTKGPGVTNVATGIGSAHLDRAPVLLFSSHFGASPTAVNVRQHIPSVRFYEPLTKLSAEPTAHNAHKLLPEAVGTAMSGYPGPVYVGSIAAEQLKDLAVADGELEAIIGGDPAAEPPPADEPAIDAAARELASAERLLVVVGPGVEHANARAELLTAVGALGAPVCVTPEAVGWVPADHLGAPRPAADPGRDGRQRPDPGAAPPGAGGLLGGEHDVPADRLLRRRGQLRHRRAAGQQRRRASGGRRSWPRGR
jgi:acetolactate synthase-1/2/3 large subunit